MNNKKEKRFNIWIELVMWAISIVFVYPILMVVMTSFKKKTEANVLSVSLPSEWMFENYQQVWEKAKIGQSLLNSLQITTFSVILILVFASTLSFVLVRRNTRACRAISGLLSFGIIAPMAILPTSQLLRFLGLYGEKAALVFVYAAIYLPFSVMLFSSFIKTLPVEMDEAGVIDGTRGFGLFFRIIFPLLRPVTTTIGVLAFMWVWNDFQYPLYLLNSSAKWTLPLSVYSFYGQYSRSWNLVCADMVIVSIPVVLLYMFAQKYIVSGMTAGAVKG